MHGTTVKKITSIIALNEMSNGPDIHLSSSSSSYICHGVGHLLTRSGLTYPEVSSKVCHGSFCQLGNSVSLPWEMPFLNTPVQRLKVAILPMDLPCSGPVTHSGGNFNHWQVSWEEAVGRPTCQTTVNCTINKQKHILSVFS